MSESQKSVFVLWRTTYDESCERARHRLVDFVPFTRHKDTCYQLLVSLVDTRRVIEGCQQILTRWFTAEELNTHRAQAVVKRNCEKILDRLWTLIVVLESNPLAAPESKERSEMNQLLGEIRDAVNNLRDENRRLIALLQETVFMPPCGSF